jgi:hypothetical protein
MAEELKPENTDFILLTYKDEFNKIVSSLYVRDMAPDLNVYKFKRTKQFSQIRADEWVHIDIFDEYNP